VNGTSVHRPKFLIYRLVKYEESSPGPNRENASDTLLHFLEAGFLAEAVRPVTPLMDEDYEARSTAFTVCFIECRTV